MFLGYASPEKPSKIKAFRALGTDGTDNSLEQKEKK